MKQEQILALAALVLAMIGLLYFTSNKPLPIPIKETTLTIERNITATRIEPQKGDVKSSDPLHLITHYQASFFDEGELFYQGEALDYKKSGKKIYFTLLGDHPSKVSLTLRKKVPACFIPKELVFSKDGRLYIYTDKPNPISPIKEDTKAYYIHPPCPKEALLFKEPPQAELPDR